jgi:ubiquinone/menaquinone biosynthesis C-methylase UbiE
LENGMQRLKRIPPSAYRKEYFLSDFVEGYEEFKRGDLSLVKSRQLDLLDLEPGLSVLEVGYGRGELLLHCAMIGARVTGVDYSPDAHEIAVRTLSDFPDADLRVADCRELPFAENSFDRVVSGDVIEHLNGEDGLQMLREIKRVLRPGGFLVIHTSPNTVFTRLLYPVARLLLLPTHAETVRMVDRTIALAKDLHIREYNLWTLRRATRRAGLEGAEVWIHPDILRSARNRFTADVADNPLVRLVGRMGGFGPARFLLGNDLYLKYRKAG